MHIILHRYIKKIIVLSIMIVFVVLISLSSIIRLIDELRKMEEQDYSFYGVIIYLFLSLPKDFELFLPMVILLGGLLGLGILEAHNELITMQVSGISKLQISISVIKSSIPILLCGLICSEWILPYSERVLYNYKNCIQHDVNIIPNKSENLLWFVDRNYFISIKNILKYDKLLGVTLYYFDEDKNLKKILFVESAVFINDFWCFSNIDELDFSVETTGVISKRLSFFEWKSVLTPYILSMLLKHPSTLSISKLYYCVQYLNKVGQNSKYYQLILWNKILSPLFGFIMIIMALSCTFGPLYKKKVSIRLFLGVIIGFIFYVLNQIFGMLSVVHILSPIVGSILSSVLILIISAFIMWRYY